MNRFADLDRPPLDADALRAAVVRPGGWYERLDVSSATPSTNADLAALARDGAPEGTVVTTDHQTSGRGRLDRGWTSPARSGIAVSVLVRPDRVPDRRWPWLPLLTGLVVDETLRRAADLDPGLKWPNDVLLDGRKTCGILLERVETPRRAAAVVGIGLNVSLRAEELPVPTATSLALAGASTTDRSVLLRTLLRTFELMYRAWEAAEGDPRVGLHTAYAARCDTLGREVSVTVPDGAAVVGTAEAVDDEGRLVVRTAGGARSLSAGDVLHVRPAT